MGQVRILRTELQYARAEGLVARLMPSFAKAAPMENSPGLAKGLAGLAVSPRPFLESKYGTRERAASSKRHRRGHVQAKHVGDNWTRRSSTNSGERRRGMPFWSHISAPLKVRSFLTRWEALVARDGITAEMGRFSGERGSMHAASTSTVLPCTGLPAT
jgi:hypothetical protein